MQRSDIAKILTYINAIDARIVLDDSKVIAWERLLHPHLPYDLAMECVDRHYANSREAIMPSDINYLQRSNAPAFVLPEIDTRVDHEWRGIVAADLKAKLQVDKTKPYQPNGIPWESEMGTGQYAAKVGIDVFDENIDWGLGSQMPV